MPYRTFGIDELGRYLHLSRADLDRLVKNQDIPFEKRGNRLVFRKVDIDAWASRRILGFEAGRLATYHRQSSTDAATFLADEALMPDLVKLQCIDPALPAKTKASALREMVALAAKSGLVSDPPALLESIEAREALCSTGLPGGLALLHPRYPDPALIEVPCIAIGHTVQGIPFGAPDRDPTDLFFLLGCSDDRLHLHALARICLMAQKTELLTRLRQVATAEEIRQEILEAEKAVLQGN